MGNTCSNVGPVTADKSIRAQQEEVNRSIEKDLLAEKKKKVLKLLLLGPGDSGKSTTLKQIRIIHDQGFTDDEKRQRKYIVYLNLISGMIEVIRGVSILSLTYKNANSEELAKKITKYYDEVKNSDAAELTEVVADSIGRLLEDPSVQEVLRQSSELSIEESSKYFLRELPRIRENDYLPSLEDILKSRVSTSGVYQFTFLIKNFTFKSSNEGENGSNGGEDGSNWEALLLAFVPEALRRSGFVRAAQLSENDLVKFRVFDVGGQKAQRRKWIHIFDDVHAVLFITSLSEYNQVLAEDNKTNRMRDSIELFDQICNNEWFSSTAMILFLNKIDLFAEKIKKFNITCALKNYRGTSLRLNKSGAFR
ncbi:hypothetical protein Y032_0004g2214 [Ancylostoma ceylanicum]|uniref:G-protein alpha subunit n=1 Tax=Ancylostoma ceylanicum TaxID=53326 RepID=A0A016VX48_9BILA|nr:hypothetical protein Y032_0004g2214 [Ancylostoma ceylanicum]